MSFAKKYATSQLGVLEYKGVWNASTNTPQITSSVGDKGDYYIVSIAGNTNLNGITDWQPGDWVLFSGSEWQKLDNSDSSLEGRVNDIETNLKTPIVTILENSPTVYADGQPPSPDSNYRDGWYFRNAGPVNTMQNKINWYFFDGQTENVNLGDLSAYCVITFDSVADRPHLVVYTVPTASGNVASWYKSRTVYVSSVTPLTNVKYLMYFGQDPKVHPELPRLSMVVSTVSAGTQAPTERVLTVVLGSNSGSPINATAFLAESLGIYTPNIKRKIELEIRKTTKAEFTTESNARVAADTLQTNNLNAEINARHAADAVLQTDIDTEKNRALSAEQNIQTDLNIQKSRLDIMDIIDTTPDVLIYENSPSVYADARPPTQDPNYRVGWYFKNLGPVGNASQNKINWYFFDGTVENISVANFSAYAVITMDSLSSKPFFGIYTMPTGSGDAASWYKSRRSFVIAGTPVIGTKYLVYYGQDPKVYPELPRLTMTDSGNSAGSFALTERIMTIALSSDSGATINACQFLTESVGIYSPNIKRNINLRIRSSTVSDLNAEIAARSNGDNTILTGLNNEITARVAADTSLQNSISTETQRAIAAENNLQILANEAKDRSFHTGVQLSNTISDFIESVHDAVTSIIGDSDDIQFIYPDENGKLQASLKTSGVQPGVYNTLTVDSKGRVIAAANSESGNVAQIASVSGNINTTTLTSFIDVVGLTTPNLLPGIYKFTFMGLANSTSTTTGIGVKLVSKTASISTIYAKYTITQSVPGTTQSYQYDQISQNTNVTSTSSVSTAFGFVLKGEGVVRVLSSGTLAIQFRSEVADSAVSLNQDSVLILEKL